MPLQISDVCRDWRRDGECPREHCRFAHRLPSPPREPQQAFRSVPPSNRRRSPPPHPPPPPPQLESHRAQGCYGNEMESDNNQGRDRGRVSDERNVVIRSPPECEGRPHWQERSRFERQSASELNTRRQEQESYNTCMQELVKQNRHLRDDLGHLEQEHYKLEMNTLDQNKHLSRRLELMADFQRNIVMRLWRNEPAIRSAIEDSVSLAGLSSILPRNQLGILGKQPGQPDLFAAGQQQRIEARLARQLMFQNRLQSGLRLTEEQLLCDTG
ncbi:uncharacterized protein [Amphiura filiformis]|uniref:uncharacterized protein n=1 Tax=Amphiura filiformis TaxID=82378 RepID=UPI003B2231E5